LIETVIALGLIAAIILEVASVQGNAIYFSGYGRNVTQAIGIARQMLSQVELDAQSAEAFKDLLNRKYDEDFKAEGLKDYRVNLTVKEWKLPLTEILSGGLKGDQDKESDDGENQKDGMGDALAPIIEQVFGDDPVLLIAKVEVSWPEGVHRGNIESALLLGNMQKVNEAILRLGAQYQDPAAKKEGAAGTVPPGNKGQAAPGETGGDSTNPPEDQDTAGEG
jgi:hypothetical protein